MPPLLLLKLLAIFATIGIGWAAGRSKAFSGGKAARIVSNAAFFIAAPALLFAQRYRRQQGEATATIVLSMLALVATSPLWLLLLQFFTAS